jgi:hypothetical protein
MKANAARRLALSQRESWSNGIHLARGDRELEERLAKTNHLHVELYPELIGSTDTTALANHFTSFVRYLCMLQRREKCFCDLVINRGRNLE